MTLNSTWNTTQEQHTIVLKLLNTRESLCSQDIRLALGCSTSNVSKVMEELVSQGLVQINLLRNSIRYSKREFEHDLQRVQDAWFGRLETHFADGTTETSVSVARKLHLNLEDARATLEEMRKKGILYGRFVGQMCIYSLRQRGTTLQASEEQMDLVLNSPLKQQQRSMEEAAATPRNRSRSRASS
ncbi:hypothetical protein [Deinococcus roseus]|uniref:MarR family transcriptional regulator n=1 Tax=Deinococcus roseus TaxID=392414 RepID=A0ABQ2CWT3_9DEIO|nr:hypothetical protein [Deinococcus roseus]GGJ28515.1 hypothetical protein GCM10008938_13240 [Deinococcus roseus]